MPLVKARQGAVPRLERVADPERGAVGPDADWWAELYASNSCVYIYIYMHTYIYIYIYTHTER